MTSTAGCRLLVAVSPRTRIVFLSRSVIARVSRPFPSKRNSLTVPQISRGQSVLPDNSRLALYDLQLGRNRQNRQFAGVGFANSPSFAAWSVDLNCRFILRLSSFNMETA